MENNTTKKYTLVKEDTIEFNGRTLYRIQALRDFGDVKKGDLGGYVESEYNLSHEDFCWIYDHGMAFDYAKVFEFAEISGNATICGNARVFGHAGIYQDALICDDVKIYGDSCINGSVEIFNDTEVKDTHIYGSGKVWGTNKGLVSYTNSNETIAIHKLYA